MGLSPPKMWHPPTCLQKCMVLPQCFKLQEPQRLLDIPILTLPALIWKEIFARTLSQILFEIVRQFKFSKTLKSPQKLLAHFLFTPPMGKFTKRPGRWTRQIFHLWKLMVLPLPPFVIQTLQLDPIQPLNKHRPSRTKESLARHERPWWSTIIVILRSMTPEIISCVSSLKRHQEFHVYQGPGL